MSDSHYNQHRFEQFRSGNRDAFEYYYHRYVERIHFYLQELAGSWAAATDQTQQAFVILYAKKQTIVDEAHLRAFLYATAKNLSSEYLREAGRLKELKEGFAYLAEQQTAALDVREAEQVKGELLMALRTSWLKLSARRRRVVVLYYFHNKSSMEIAHQLKIDRQTVLNHLSQSIILLRKGLDGRWEEVNLF
ncbi:MAG TPA: sigma-70 family RNA polymerase sigma factor [Puia sp.]|jgi:RNA polymerase sigma-70 factor (ECF subfamily)